MKKIFLLLMLAMAMQSYGQFNSESFYFTGATRFNTGLEITEGVPSLLLGLHPEAGYFVKNKVAVGGGVNFDLFIPIGQEGFYQSIYDINFGPNLRKYIPQVSDWQYYIFVYPHYGFMQDFESSEEFSYIVKHQYYGLQVGPGINYFFNERIALDARFTYMFRHAWNRIGGGNHNMHRFFFELGISVYWPSITFWERSQ